MDLRLLTELRMNNSSSVLVLQIRSSFELSPANAENQKSFLDMNFPEEEDDDEYQPSTEEMEEVTSSFLIVCFLCNFLG